MFLTFFYSVWNVFTSYAADQTTQDSHQ